MNHFVRTGRKSTIVRAQIGAFVKGNQRRQLSVLKSGGRTTTEPQGMFRRGVGQSPSGMSGSTKMYSSGASRPVIGNTSNGEWIVAGGVGVLGLGMVAMWEQEQVEAQENKGIVPRVVFATGRGSYGQLGLGNEKNVFKPERVSSLDQEMIPENGVSAGGFVTAAIISDEGVFTWGSGREFALGHDDDNNESLPRLVEEGLEGEENNIAQVAVGGNHVLVLTQDGRVFSCGQGYGGRLGHGSDENQKIPKMIDGLKGVRVVDVSASHDHSLALAEDGTVYVWGGKRLGRVALIENQKDWGVKANENSTPRALECKTKSKIVKVATGNSGSHALVTEKGQLYTFGNNETGALGNGRIEYEDVSKPFFVRSLKHKVIKDVSIGQGHTVVLTEDGQVYTWGSGRQGQLGHGTTSDCLTPQLVERLEGVRIVKIAAGSSHTAVLDDTGKVWVFGKNSEGQLGLDDIGYRSEPVVVKGLPSVVDVVCGDEHSVFVANAE